MYAERLLRGTVKPPFRALAVLAITVVLVGRQCICADASFSFFAGALR